MKVLLDTCIVIDVLQSRVPFAESGQEIFLLAATEQIEGCLTANSMTDIYYLTRRQTHEEQTSRSIIAGLCELFEILDTTKEDITSALASDTSDFEDAVMIATAVRGDVDCIITRNEKDFANSAVKVYNPDEFIKNAAAGRSA